MSVVNYEDREDLLPPDQVVSGSLLSKLWLTREAARYMRQSLDGSPPVEPSPGAYEAIVLRVAEDTAPGSGAPAVARAAEEDAMLCGYRFGQLALGPLPRRRPITPEEIRQRTDSMDLYALLIWDAHTPGGRVPVDAILSRHGAEHIHALEEAVTWAWAFGLGVALIEADLDAA